MLRYLVICAFLTIPGIVWPQAGGQQRPQSADKKIEKVKLALDHFDFAEAKKLSGKLIEQYPEWPEGWKIYAQVYQSTGETQISEKALKRLVELDSVNYPEAFRWMAEWMYKRGDYHNAGLSMGKFIRLCRDTSALPFQVRLINASIKYALAQLDCPDIKFPEKLNGLVNTSDDEYFPSLSVDGSFLVFTRQIRNVPVTSGKPPQEDLFFTSCRDTGNSIPEPFSYPINTPGNEGTQSLRQDGRIMFFTGCNRPDTKGGCDIYYCVRSGDKWSNPINLGNPVNSRYWDSTPFLAQNGRQLFFASNRPGGFGGMDLWVATLNPDGTWLPPQNLGKQINTPFDEMSPVLLVDGYTLFFASNGHIGMGGFDLFTCNLVKPAGSITPVNLGYGINSYHDEDAITVNASSNLGLIASNRDSLTGKDIYQVDMSRFIAVNSVITFEGIVLNRFTRNPVGAKIEIQPHGDTLISSVESDPVTGKFLLAIPQRKAYRIGASCPGYLPYSEYYISDEQSKILGSPHLIELEPIKIGASIVLQNIFFEFNSYELLPESSKDLDEILSVFRKNPGIVIEISGYTDSTGKDDYNLALSQKRAESVMKYLIDKGISANQLSAKGYGKSNPIASNETEEGKSHNRRTEMKVIRIK